MNDLIERQAAIDIIKNGYGKYGNITWIDRAMLIEELKDLPPAHPEPKTGHWIILDSDSERYEDIKCPFCGHTFTVDAWRWCDIGFIKEDFKFCPNCGVKMERGNDG